MRDFIGIDVIKEKPVFWSYFFVTGFPSAKVQSLNIDLYELMEEKYDTTDKFIDTFTKYYPGVLDDSDGYIDDPSTIKLQLASGSNFYVEFHPGDTIYYIDEETIGCTGPHFKTHQIPWNKFKSMSENLSPIEKLFILPMVYITPDERNEFVEILKKGLEETTFNQEDYDFICTAVSDYCCKELS